VVRLHTADRDERVAPLREGVRSEVLELAHLVAAVRKTRVAVLALRPDVDVAAEVLTEPLETMDGRRSEEERDPIETSIPTVRDPRLPLCSRGRTPGTRGDMTTPSCASVGVVVDGVDDCPRDGASTA
jgi:hypothetical protein